MRKIGILFMLASSQADAMGIAGKSGDELLYLYIIFIVLALSFIGLDHLIKFAKQKFQDWKSPKEIPPMNELN
jgi:hypothetical protein